MMKTRLCMMIFAWVFLMTTSVMAAGDVMQIKPYYADSCKNLSGVWQGNAYDPTGLFGDGGPWPLTLNVSVKQNDLYGEIKGVKNTSVKNALTGRIWATCADNAITNLIHMTENNSCGASSPVGVLATPSLLLLYVHWENAMNGTDFLLVLHKKSSTLGQSAIKDLVSKAKPDFKSCH